MKDIRPIAVQKKIEVKELYVKTNLTAKEISIQTGITEKTIGKWIKTYGWKIQREMIIAKELGLQEVGKICRQQVIADLKKHLKKLNPSLLNQVGPLIDNFLQLK